MEVTYVIVSKNIKPNQKKVYHTKKCIHTKRIKEDNKLELTLTQAKKKGYKECQCCHGMSGLILENKTNIKNWKKNNDIKFYYAIKQRTLYVRTEIGFWRISMKRGTDQLLLYHRNNYNENLTYTQAKAGGFHRQTELAQTQSLQKIVEFIIKHDKAKVIIQDDYRKLPRATKKQKKYYNFAKKKEQKKAIQRLDKLFEQIKTT